jgi:hypothetical protein
MRIISIDVGIKNLAYCILESVNADSYKIIQWDIINLCGEDAKCVVCLKKAKYFHSSKNEDEVENEVENEIENEVENEVENEDETKNYCHIHAKKMNYIPPCKKITPAKLKKMKIEQLQQLANQYKISWDTTNDKTHLINLIQKRMVELISKKSANKIDFVTIGLALKTELDKIFSLATSHLGLLDFLDHIIIENQISPIANRMKTLQGMIAQYFIMRGKSSIVFASSINKLKAFVGSEKTSYDERKKLGVEVTSGLLMANNDNVDCFIHHKKKDDLADSFLQGIWYLQKRGLAKINYMHQLK